ncbi:MAG: formylglycine-generating enzyme family protein [Bacteroidales bacterium]|jgi:formylglycine-generating enzyme required for sulfatase activity|nr:formylglycine-generating enzyme family protein [Bacteroidales bacterium]
MKNNNLKSVFLTFFFCVAVSGVHAQEKSMQIYYGGSVAQSVPVSKIDSIAFANVFAAPANVTAVLNDSVINISWSSVPNVTNYEVYRSGNNKNYTLLAGGVVTTTFTDNTPLPGANYYKVKGVSATVDGALSAASQAVVYSGNFTETNGGLNFEMIAVNGGTFTMGCTSEQGGDCNDDESPSHQVTLSNFYIGKYEVTQKLWWDVVGFWPGSAPSNIVGVGNNYPMYDISHTDLQIFLTKLNQITGKTYRLPTEAEWEYAARGGDQSQGYKYSGSNTVGDVAWYYTNSDNKTHEVGTKAANELGLYDMSGNVWEWCSDWYGDYTADVQTDPTGAASGSDRVLRGGSWNYADATYCRVSYRNKYVPANRNSISGFRLVLVSGL